jgi:anti-sigma B factor antagonist
MIEIETRKHCTLVRLSGEIDQATAAETAETLLSLIEAGRINLAINMRDLTYISSAGLRVLMLAQIQARRTKPPGKVVFSELAAPIEKIFKMVGFDEFFEFYTADAEALASF